MTPSPPTRERFFWLTPYGLGHTVHHSAREGILKEPAMAEAIRYLFPSASPPPSGGLEARVKRWLRQP